MKYLVRAIKYFIYFAIIMTVIILALVLIGAVEADINSIFKDGVESVWKILGFLAAISAIYPAFGYMRKDACIHGSMEENRNGIVEFMESRGYVVTDESADKIVFRCSSKVRRLTRMWEDSVIVTPNIMGVQLEGYRKDLVRLVMGLENKFRGEESEEA